MAPVPHSSVSSVLMNVERFSRWMERVNFYRKFSLGMIFVAIAAGVATYLTFSQSGLLSHKPRDVILLLNLDLIIVLIWAALIARRVVKLWVERRKGRAGSKLHVMLVILFSVLTITPTIVVTALSSIFFNLGIQSWFSNRVNTALKESTTVAEAYLAEHKKVIRATLELMASDLAHQYHALEHDPERFNHALDVNTIVRSLDEAIVFAPNSHIIARSRLSFSIQFERITDEALEKAKNEVVILTGGNDRVRALVKIAPDIDAYLLVGRFIEPKIQERINQVQNAVSEYHALEKQRGDLEVKFALIFIVLSLFLLMISIWIGLLFATRLVRPISQLIEIAERVSSGDLTARVPEDQGRDEIAVLSRTFNRMTAELKQQHDELVVANLQLNIRRQFIEDVLAGVSAGVIGVSPQGDIQLANRSANEMLALDLTHLSGKSLVELVPEFIDLMEQANHSKESFVQSQVNITRKGITRTLLVRAVIERNESHFLRGFIVTFDDITGLVQAQRKAAWADVARRIAHEIKNPLTPISLSAERLRRRYQKFIPDNEEAFQTCIDTIIRQVDHIGRMVGEFSAYARMPAPKMSTEDLVKLAKESLFLQQSAHLDIHFVFETFKEILPVYCDASQIGQVLTNLLQNAVDSLQVQKQKMDEAGQVYQPQIDLRISCTSHDLKVIVEDNGEGFPTEDRYSILEPYITKKVKGTGLGLAIVKKIVEDHLGSVVLGDREGGGAQIQLIFPLSMLADNRVSFS
jgi:two-component system nitrogen regulation sensor histidine kinase NtrY